MPTAELISTEKDVKSPEAQATEDIDAMLAQADALMDQVQANLGEQAPVDDPQPQPSAVLGGADAEPVAAETGPEPVATEPDPAANPADAAQGARHDVAAAQDTVENVAVPVVNADAGADAIVADSNPDAEGAAESPADAPAAGGPSPSAEPTAEVEPVAPAGDGPKPAPKEWIEEAASANLHENTDTPLPSIPEGKGAALDGNAIAAAADHKRSKRLARHLTTVLRGLCLSPIHILTLVDTPFAGLSPKVKSCIGYAGIGTLLVATATWIFGNLHHPA